MVSERKKAHTDVVWASGVETLIIFLCIY